jgi:hypothetical protein
MSRLLTLLALTFALLVSGRARAQDDAYAWTMPPPEVQLAQDESVIPVGRGAVFVPSITGPDYEPAARLVSGEEILSVPLGQRFLVNPGRYVVLMGSGAASQGASVAIEVREGETTMVPVSWGALRIEVTDDRRIPHRGTYEIIRADTRQPVGTGFGADTLQGEILQTWILPPGIYRIVRPGRNSRALRDFATVVVPDAGFVRYRLVMDEDTGEFLGSGVLLADEFMSGNVGDSRLFKSMVIGFDGALTSYDNVVGFSNETQVSAAVFLDSQFAFNSDPHRLSFLIQVDEGARQRTLQPDGDEPDPLPIEKVTDRLRGDLLYTYTLRGRTGPYGRVSAESQAFPTDQLVVEDTTYLIRYEDGNEEYREIASGDTFHLSDAWNPTQLREGVGINTTFLEKNRSMNFNWRIGYGLRQNFYGQALVLNDVASTPEIEYDATETYFQRGVESTVIASLRLPGRIVYSTDLEFFAPFTILNDPTDPTTWEEQISISWRNNLSVRLTRNLSLNYFANVDLEPQVVKEPQVQHNLTLRASWSVF